MSQRRSYQTILILICAARFWLPGDRAASADDRAWRMVTAGKLEKSTNQGYTLRDDDGQIAYRIASAEGIDLSQFVGQRVQVIGSLDDVSPNGLQNIHAEKLVVADEADTDQVVALKGGSGGTSDDADGSVLEKIQRPPPVRSVGPRASDDSPELLPDDSALFLNAPLNGPLVEESAEPLIDAQAPSFYDPPIPYRASPADIAPYRIWAQVDYLRWWTRGFETPALITTSPTGTPQEDAGVLGKPDTTILFGQDKLFTDNRRGARMQLGGWLGRRHRLGVEVEYLGLEDEDFIYTATSNGSVIVARPFFNVDPDLGLNQGHDAVLVSYPNQITGMVQVEARSSFNDFGVLLRTPLLDRNGTRYDPCNPVGAYTPGYRLHLAGGYRFYRLKESLTVQELLTFSVTPQAGQVIRDEFFTDSEFNGGELGLYGEYYRGRWSVDGVVRLALGNTRQRVEIRGITETSTVGIITPFDGGLLALPTNMGVNKRNKADLIPEFGINVGYMMTGRLQLVFGYTIIYWPHVVRPGNEVDLVINGSYIPDPTRTPAGAPTPVFGFYDTGYWAQGFNFGLDYRW